MRLHHMIRTAPLVAALALGCSGGLSNFKEPDIRLDRVNVRGLGVTGGNLDLVVSIENPNGYTVRGTRLDVGFDVENSHVGDISYNDEFSVTGNGLTTLTLPIRFNWTGVGGALRSVLGYGDLPYTLKGQAHIKAGGTEVVVPFTKSGRAPLTRSDRAPSVGTTTTDGNRR
jgi:LEA14-like dessication related protein